MRTLRTAAFLLIAIVYPATAQDMDQAMKSWEQCKLNTAALFARSSSDSADVVASGVFGACEPAQFNYITTLMKITKSFDPETPKRMMRDMKEEARDRLIAEIISQRARK
ncbi:hypothetical protein [Neorhizobium galegae]|uniref:Uncharacterized protein n=1 Tax=Neorhizobium galegae bv. orientalis str. HAMBI 540 TaxID=1028800 RepID=A0A068SNZ7_NEOGA|nr:hypothetical protein [Neorhizobium galegae]CDN47579.1 Hypothetical protein RG540_CH13990 [Neorhizobium galegae bv. orientalis str. HAMBI 540]